MQNNCRITALAIIAVLVFLIAGAVFAFAIPKTGGSTDFNSEALLLNYINPNPTGGAIVENSSEPPKTEPNFELPAISATANKGETFPADPNMIITTTQTESTNDPTKADYNPDDFAYKANLFEKKPVIEARTDGNAIDSSQIVTEDIIVPAEADSCGATTEDLYNYIYRAFIESPGDTDWYRGYKAGTNTLRFILVPPYNRDYDIEIYDNCGSSYVQKCTSGTGVIENCLATVSNDFYVRVYGYNGAYSASALYKITAKDSGTVNAGMFPGTPSKTSFLCNDTIRINNIGITNLNSGTMYYYFYHDLYTPSNNYYTEYNTGNEYYSLPPTTSIPWLTNFYPPGNGWTENGIYIARAFMIYWTGTNIQATSVKTYPNVSCERGSIEGYNGTPIKSSFACNEQIQSTNHAFKNTSNFYSFNYTVYNELRDPNNNFVASSSLANQTLSPEEQKSYLITYYPATNGWPMPGTYTVKSWATGTFTYGRSTTAYSYAYPYVPTAPCSTCADECSAGATRCLGNASQTCGNYDSDSCREWGNNQDCGATTYGSPYCYNGDVYKDRTDRGCSGSSCFTSAPTREIVQDCGTQTCSNGSCDTCTPHKNYYCANVLGNKDVYWFNSCGQREEIKEDCRLSCVEGVSTCDSSCLGSFTVWAKNKYNTPLVNATVSFDGGYGQGEKFAGTTGTDGRLTFGDIQPGTCPTGRVYSIKVISAEGTNCGTKNALTWYEADNTLVIFNCNPVSSNNKITLGIISQGISEGITQSIFEFGEPIIFKFLAKDLFQNPISNALIGIIPGYDASKTGTGITNSTGNASYTYAQTPIGTHRYRFIGSKEGYQQAETEKILTIKEKRGYDSDGDGLSDEIEKAIGTNPNDPNSNLASIIGENAPSTCFLTLPFGTFSIEQKQEIINTVSSKGITSIEEIKNASIMGQQIETQKTTLKNAIQEASEIQYFAKKDGYVIITTNEKTGSLSIYFLQAFCVGMLKGVAYGLGQGITDDAALITAGYFYATNLDELQEAMNQAQNQLLLYYAACTYFYPQQGKFPPECQNDIVGMFPIFSDLVLKSASDVFLFADTQANTQYKQDFLDRASFDSGFFAGYTGTYFLEQIVTLKGVELAGKETIKIGGKLVLRFGGPAAKGIMALDGWQAIAGKIEPIAIKLEGVIDNSTIRSITDSALKSRVGKAILKNWTKEETEGFVRFVAKSEEKQGDAIMYAMKQSGEWTDNMAKEAVKIDGQGNLINFEKAKLIPNSGKNADAFFRINNNEFWIDSTEIQNPLESEQSLFSKLTSIDRAKKFEGLGVSGEGIQVIKLSKGTTLKSNQIISTIEEALPQMIGTKKVIVYDTVKDLTFIATRR